MREHKGMNESDAHITAAMLKAASPDMPSLRDRFTVEETAWDIRFEANRGQRVKKRFWGATIMSPTDLWWDEKLRKWVDFEARVGALSTHTDTRSYKAFLRLIRKHPELPVGTELCLVSRWLCKSIYATRVL